MAKGKEVKERGGRNYKYIIPQGEGCKFSAFDKLTRLHRLESEGCVFPVLVKIERKIISPDVDLTYNYEEMQKTISYTIGEN